MKIISAQNQSGLATLIVLMMISFMLVFVLANSNSLFNLKREVKLLDRQQKARAAAASTNTPARNALTNSVSATVKDTK